METLFNQIQALVAEKLSWLHENVDEDYGQLEMLLREDEDSDTYPLTFPLVLISTPEVTWTSMGGACAKVQTGTASVSIRLALDCYDDTHYTGNTADKARERAGMVHELHALLQGWMPLYTSSPLDRKSSRAQTMARGIKVYELNYECRVIEMTNQE